MPRLFCLPSRSGHCGRLRSLAWAVAASSIRAYLIALSASCSGPFLPFLLNASGIPDYAPSTHRAMP